MLSLAPLIIIDLSEIGSILSFFSSVAIILGAIFVVFQIRDNKKLIMAANQQAKAAAVQANITSEQLKQNNEIADMDLIMRLYEFANSSEVQTAWLNVLNSRKTSFEEFEKLPKSEQVSFYQIAALFESLGVLVDRGIVKLDVVEDVFLTEVAWKAMEPFLSGIRQKYGEEENYVFFERLYKKLIELHKNLRPS
jgi:hypothetical protein